MVKRRNKKTEIKRLKEENKLLREWNSNWQIVHARLWKNYMDMAGDYSLLRQKRKWLRKEIH